MKDFEEGLQKRIESGASPHSEDINGKAYQQIFGALKKDPGYELPPQFGATVLEKIASREVRGHSTAFFWLAAGIFFLVLAFFGAVLSTGFRMDFGFLSKMSDYKGFVAFALLFIALLHWLDRKLINPQRSMAAN